MRAPCGNDTCCSPTSLAMIEINVQDEFHYLFILSILDILLFFAVFLRSDGAVPRMVFAANAALILQWWIQSSFDPEDWPRRVYSNNVILFMFTIFMYFIMASLWACIFLVIGLMFIDPVWENIRTQLELVLQTTIGFAVHSSNHGVMFWGFAIFLCFCIGVAWISKVKWISQLITDFAYSTRLVTAMKALFISQGTIICTVEAGSKMCPFWFDRSQWWMTIAAFLFRFVLIKVLPHRSVKTDPVYKSVATTDSTGCEDVELHSDDSSSDSVSIPVHTVKAVRIPRKPPQFNRRLQQNRHVLS